MKATAATPQAAARARPRPALATAREGARSRATTARSARVRPPGARSRAPARRRRPKPTTTRQKNSPVVSRADQGGRAASGVRAAAWTSRRAPPAWRWHRKTVWPDRSRDELGADPASRKRPMRLPISMAVRASRAPPRRVRARTCRAAVAAGSLRNCQHDGQRSSRRPERRAQEDRSGGQSRASALDRAREGRAFTGQRRGPTPAPLRSPASRASAGPCSGQRRSRAPDQRTSQPRKAGWWSRRFGNGE